MQYLWGPSHATFHLEVRRSLSADVGRISLPHEFVWPGGRHGETATLMNTFLLAGVMAAPCRMRQRLLATATSGCLGLAGMSEIASGRHCFYPTTSKPRHPVWTDFSEMLAMELCLSGSAHARLCTCCAALRTSHGVTVLQQAALVSCLSGECIKDPIASQARVAAPQSRLAPLVALAHETYPRSSPCPACNIHWGARSGGRFPHTKSIGVVARRQPKSRPSGAGAERGR